MIIFQSDNGGGLSVKTDLHARRQESCNFPYKGYKNTLFEGGTLSPSFIYSTKTSYPERIVKTQFHIVDWMPTILYFANAPAVEGLDGVNQQIHIRRPANQISKPRRKNFIYGVLNGERNGEIYSHYGVRYGRYKYLNFRQHVPTIKCQMSTKDMLKAIENKKIPERNRYVNEVQLQAIYAEEKIGNNPYQSGFSLFDLEKDPFELHNLYDDDVRKIELKHLKVIGNINTYIVDEIKKDFQIPVQGVKYNGRVFHEILRFVMKSDKNSKHLQYYSDLNRIKPYDGTYVLNDNFCEDDMDAEILFFKDALKNNSDATQAQNRLVDYYTKLITEP